jgi:hypothetical protein
MRMTRRWLAIGVTLLLLLAASAATVAHHSPGHDGGPSGPEEPSDDGASEDPDDGTTGDDNVDESQPSPGPLLTSYSFTDGQEENFAYLEDGFVDGLQQEAPHGVRSIVDTGPYSGWDVLLTDQYDQIRHLATDNWITLQISRPTTVAVVWQADQPVPAWLDGWTYVGDSVVIEDSISPKPRQVYEREFDAGEVVLGGVYSEGEAGDQRSPYIVVLDDGGSAPPPEDDDGSGGDDNGDSDGGDHGDDDHHGGDSPGDGEYVDDVNEWLYGTHHWSVEPLSVVNPDDLEEPVEGQSCPDWLNFAHTTQAADGNYYLTWRPIVDPNYGCHFSYENGANPARVEGASMPAFGYGTAEHMRESQYGFKVKALHAPDGTEVLATTHFGTAEPHLAACQRFHWNNFQFVQDGEVVADITFMGDFGSARKNDSDEPLNRDCVDPRTGETKSQTDIMQETNGVRLNPVCTGPNADDCGPFYYPWRMDNPGMGNFLGFKTHAYTVNTPTVMAACADMTCQESRHIGGTGAWAFVAFGTGFGVVDEGLNGEFYTDPFGMELRDPSDADAVRQFIKPGTNIGLDGGGDGHSYFPDARYGGTHGDYVHTLMENGDPNIMGNVRQVVDPQGWISGKN